MTIKIAGVPVGPGYPARFVAELSNNHNGSLDTARRLIATAKLAGADFVKVQAYTPDELVALRGDGPAPEPWGAQGWSMHDLYTVAQTPLAWLPALAAEAYGVGLPLFASVFGATSLAACQAIGCPAYKIARLDNHHAPLLAAVKATRKPLLVSMAPNETAGAHAAALEAADVVLACPPGYPQAADAPWPRAFGGLWDGASYHGTDPAVPARLARAGAALVEVHLQLDDTPSRLEATVSLTGRQFAAMVRGAQPGAPLPSAVTLPLL